VGEAASPITTGPGLAAVSIEDTEMKIGVGLSGWFNQEYLITTYAKAPIGEKAATLFGERDLLIDPVDDHEIVA
jgi:hypothetical protein